MPMATILSVGARRNRSSTGHMRFSVQQGSFDCETASLREAASPLRMTRLLCRHLRIRRLGLFQNGDIRVRVLP